MKRVSRRTAAAVVLSALLVVGMLIFVLQLFIDGGKWAGFQANAYIYSNGILQVGTVYDRNGETLLSIDGDTWNYAENAYVRAGTLHAVGDPYRNISTGATAIYADKLSGWDVFNGINGNGGDITLTIDASVSAIAWEALYGHNGTVGVFNYKTGEIICMVSSPSYDPTYPPETMPEGVYINRLLSATFVPGSVFKTVTAAAAIDNLNNIDNWYFNCTGSIIVGDTQITCPHAHGEQNFASAFANSCNCAFGELALQIGGETLGRYAESLGLTTSIEMDGISTAAGSVSTEYSSDALLAWTGSGQGETLINPCSLMVYMGAIANGGQAVLPQLLLDDGTLFDRYNTNETDELLSEETAVKMADLMRLCVTQTYGADNFPGLDICAKSGTAEVDGEIPHSWFCGFLRDEEHPYAFVVLVENAGSGAAVAGNIANTVLQTIVASDS